MGKWYLHISRDNREGWHFIKPHMSPIADLYTGKWFYFSVLKSILGIAAPPYKSRWSSAVTEMPLGQRIALAITDPGGGKWTLNGTLMVLEREKMSQYYPQLATDPAQSRTRGSRLFHICWLLQFVPRWVQATAQQCLRVSSVADE